MPALIAAMVSVSPLLLGVGGGVDRLDVVVGHADQAVVVADNQVADG